MTDAPYPSGEYALLAELQVILGAAAAPGAPYPTTLGDDAAIRLSSSGERLVLTTDIAVEKVHFNPADMTFREVGFKIMAANVSDCAAMGALPEAALVNLVFPASGGGQLREQAMELYRGFAEACGRWNFRIIGGDLASGPAWTIAVTMIGKASENGRLLLRKGILPGDRLWVTDFPGRSAAGLAALEKWGRKMVPARYSRLVQRHVRPEPDVALGALLGSCAEVRAMMDLSDGISKDCRTLCFENRLGLELDLDKIKPPEDMVALSDELAVPWQDWALHGGEEYSLLFAASEKFNLESIRAAETAETKAVITSLGRFTDKHDRLLARCRGTDQEVSMSSWDHIRIGEKKS